MVFDSVWSVAQCVTVVAVVGLVAGLAFFRKEKEQFRVVMIAAVMLAVAWVGALVVQGGICIADHHWTWQQVQMAKDALRKQEMQLEQLERERAYLQLRTLTERSAETETSVITIPDDWTGKKKGAGRGAVK